MTNNRFLLDSDGSVVDTCKSNFRSHRVRYCEPCDTTESSLRETVLFDRLMELVDKLLGPFQDKNLKNRSLTRIIYHTITQSRLNTRDVSASLEHKFNGTLHSDRDRWQYVTSIALFINDIEYLLRDLYGDFDDDDAIGSIRKVLLVVVPEFLRFARNDLWLEHESAVDIDDYFEPSELMDLGICWKDLVRGADKAFAYMVDRVRDSRANPNAFCEYTASFLNAYESKCAQKKPATANDFIDFAPADNNIPF